MSNLSVYTPGFRFRDPFVREFDALVRSAFGAGSGSTAGDRTGDTLAFTPAAETLRDGDDAIVRVELPGLDLAGDIDVEVTAGRLAVRGERRDERSEDAGGRHLREIRYGRFERSFRLPRHVGADAVTASYDAGVLSVRIAGVYAGTAPQKIAITGQAAEAVEPSESQSQSQSESQPDEQG